MSHKLIVVLILLCEFAYANGLGKKESQTALTFSYPRGADSVHEISGEVLKEAYSRLGIEIRLKALPSQRSLMLANKGIVDGEVTRVELLEDRLKDCIRISVSVNEIWGTLFTNVKNKEFKFKSFKDMDGHKIVIPRGTKFAENATKGMKYVTVVNTFAQAMKMVEGGKVDFAYLPYSVGKRIIQAEKLKSVVAILPAVEKTQLFHYLHKKHKDKAIKLEKILKEMVEDGSIQRIRERSL